MSGPDRRTLTRILLPLSTTCLPSPLPAPPIQVLLHHVVDWLPLPPRPPDLRHRLHLLPLPRPPSLLLCDPLLSPRSIVPHVLLCFLNLLHGLLHGLVPLPDVPLPQLLVLTQLGRIVSSTHSNVLENNLGLLLTTGTSLDILKILDRIFGNQ